MILNKEFKEIIKDMVVYLGYDMNNAEDKEIIDRALKHAGVEEGNAILEYAYPDYKNVNGKEICASNASHAAEVTLENGGEEIWNKVDSVAKSLVRRLKRGDFVLADHLIDSRIVRNLAKEVEKINADVIEYDEEKEACRVTTALVILSQMLEHANDKENNIEVSEEVCEALAKSIKEVADKYPDNSEIRSMCKFLIENNPNKDVRFEYRITHTL